MRSPSALPSAAGRAAGGAAGARAAAALRAGQSPLPSLPAPRPLPQCTRSRTHRHTTETPDTHTHTRPRKTHSHPLPAANTLQHTAPLPHARPPPPRSQLTPELHPIHEHGLPLPPLLCAPASAAAERPHMSANTSRQKPASAEQRQPGLPSSQHKAASSYFQACSLSPSEGTLLCFSLSLSSLPVQLLHNTHQLFIACLPVSRQNQSQMESC